MSTKAGSTACDTVPAAGLDLAKLRNAGVWKFVKAQKVLKPQRRTDRKMLTTRDGVRGSLSLPLSSILRPSEEENMGDGPWAVDEDGDNKRL